MDSGEAQAWIAGGAAAVAIVAAVLSALQAREAGKQADQAKRQADAAHGDVDPTFHIERLSDPDRSENCSVVVRNFNRHALALHEVRIQHATDIVLIPDSPTVHDAVRHAISRIELNRPDLSVVKPGTVLPGIGPGNDPSDYRFAFRATRSNHITGAGDYALQFSDIEKGETIELTYDVDFELLDGKGEARTFEGSAGLRF